MSATRRPDPQLPAPHPLVTPETKPFWDATAEAQLVLATCRGCDTVLWYPKAFCSACGTFDVEWVEASGRGTIYTFTITRRGIGSYADAGPYVMAYVELAEGPRLITNIVDCDPETLEIGQEVEVVFHPTGQGAALPRFRPVGT
jgi:uncharacterized protein